MLNRRIRVWLEGPYALLCRVVRRNVLCFAVDVMCFMCVLNDRCWSKWMPRNLPDDLKGIGVL